MTDRRDNLNRAPAELVSVVIPMKNGRAYIREAVASVLVEREVPVEVIVVDDGSTDGSAEAVAAIGDPRVRVIPGPNEGNIATSVNAGLAVARGTIFMRCDADDAYVPGRIARQVRWLAEHPEFVAVCGMFATMDPSGEEIAVMRGKHRSGEITDVMRQGQTPTHMNTFAFRMDVVRQIGGCRPWFSGTEDIDFQLRVATVGRVWLDDGLTYRYRLHAQSSTHTQAAVLKDFLTQTARTFAVQRQRSGADDLERGQPPARPTDNTPAHRVEDQTAGILIGRAWSEHAQGRKGLALRTGWRACRTRPDRIKPWWNLVRLFLKPVPATGKGNAQDA